ncbi:MAG: hypothetical protein QOF37_258, partial [Thermoleophilaceae bacterium]|nr:hypothetical protein [Thermoleophilaceae bacterium]
MDPVRQVADAVLYEGYLLWPYRRSAMKNTRRWTFGGVYPRDHSRGHPDDRWEMRTECLVRGGERAPVDVSVRFLHVVRRQVEVDGVPVDEVTVRGERHLSWDEATEREVAGVTGARVPVSVPAGSEREDLGAGAAIVRSWRGLEGAVEISSRRLGEGLRRITVRIANETPFFGT